MSYTEKLINVTIQLGEGQFGESGFDRVELKGLRCSVDIEKSGGNEKQPLNLRVYGLEQQMMNLLTRTGRVAWAGAVNNLISVDAGDVSGMANIYQGSIFMAWADYRASPDVAFNIEAASGWFDSIKPAEPSSYRGHADVATIIGDLASRMSPPLALVNSGVSQTIANPALAGTVWDQFMAVANATGIEYAIDPGTLTIWPKGGSRGGDVLELSPETGLVGYPQVNATGIVVACEFNPRILCGMRIRLKSDVVPATGVWRVDQIGLNLSSLTPGGPWFMTLQCSEYGRLTFHQ